MRAATYTAAGGPEVIQFREVPTPEPASQEIRVRVRATALNRADLLQRMGRYPAPPGWPADIPGLEYAGEVDLCGPGASRWRPGDRVMGLVGGGAHAECVIVHQDEALAIPDGMSFSDAAAIPEAFLTAWDALVTRGRLAAGERVLIHAVGSGVGTAAVQLAKRLGATTAGTSRNPDKLARARALGLDESICTGDPTDRPFQPTRTGDPSGRPFPASGDPLGRPFPASNDATRRPYGGPYDVIIDVLGGPALANNLDALAPRGRLVLLGFLQGPKADLSLEPILRKRLTVVGSVMRTRLLAERIPLVREFGEQVLPWFGPSATPPLRPIVGATYPIGVLADAHQAMAEDRNFGKIVLTW